MDLLKKEMARKKKALEEAKKANKEVTLKGGRFLRAGELRRLQEEQEQQAVAEAAAAQKKKQTEKDINDEYDDVSVKRKRESDGNVSLKQKRQRDHYKQGSDDGDETVTAAGTAKGKAAKKEVEKTSNDIDQQLAELSPDEISKRFRALGLPVRLFGERTVVVRQSDNTKKKYDDSQRQSRLRKALEDLKETLAGISEKEEFRLGMGHGIRNTFLEKDKSTANAAAAVAMYMSMSMGEANKRDDDNLKDDDKGEDNEDDPSDQHKQIYKYFKGLLRQWEGDLTLRSEEIKRSAAGRNEAKTLKQCKDYIRPLFKLCKSRRLDESLTKSLSKIVEYCKEGEFVKANDVYMDIAIGRAAWPIGVTMVGIHARSGRAKIESQNVAHVMNSELQRKYLTSVKRLMSYAQEKRTDVVPSKKVMNRAS